MPLRRLGSLVALACALAAGDAGAQGKSVTTTLIQRGGVQFDDQQYEESIQTLSAALVRPGATDVEKRETYRLLAYNFIILKRAEEADAAVRALLVTDEGYTLPPSESPRFRDFFAAVKRKWIDEGRPGKAAGPAPPPDKPIRMSHASPAEAPPKGALKLTGSIEDPDQRVRGVQLAYRTGTKGKFTLVAATYALGDFRATLPRLALKPPLVEYYLTAVDKGGLPLASRGDAAAPLRVVVPRESSALTSPALWIPVGVAVVGGAVATAFLLTRSRGAATVTVGVRE